MKKKIDIKDWRTGEIIFSYECLFNTIKKTVEKAVKQGVSLAYADLCNAYLKGIKLYDVDLSFADLSCTNLVNAEMYNVYLYNANLKNAILTKAKLSQTDLQYTDLKYAILNNVFFKDTNLANAHLFFTNLSTAILDNVKGLNDQCPKEGSFIGWKKCVDRYYKHYIVKLEIPADAKRSSATTNKCRCDKAKVLDIQNINGIESDINEIYSIHSRNFKYEVGEMVKEPKFDEEYWVECTRGIHFFMNREDAVNYY